MSVSNRRNDRGDHLSILEVGNSLLQWARKHCMTVRVDVNAYPCNFVSVSLGHDCKPTVVLLKVQFILVLAADVPIPIEDNMPLGICLKLTQPLQNFFAERSLFDRRRLGTKWRPIICSASH